MGTSLVACTHFSKEIGTCMGSKDHSTETLHDTVIEVCGNRVKELVNGMLSCRESLCLLSAECIQSSKEFVVHRPGITQERANNTLDVFNVMRWKDRFIVEF